MRITVEFSSMKELKEFVNSTFVFGPTKTETADAPKRRGRPRKAEKEEGS